MLVWDIETDGLLDEVTKVHCISAIDRETGREYRFTDNLYYQGLDGTFTSEAVPRDGTIADGLALLESAEVIGGHFIAGYDLPALRKLYGWEYKGYARDSKAELRVTYPNLKNKDFDAVRKKELPAEFTSAGMVGAQTLRAWGIRIGGEQKQDFNPADYGHTWKTIPFTKEMDDYCMQDVRTNVSLFDFIDSKGFDTRCLWLENKTQGIITRQEQHGWLFNEEAAEGLAKELMMKHEAANAKCQETILPFYIMDGAVTKTYKRTSKVWTENELGGQIHPKKKTRGWFSWNCAGATRSPIKMVVFNPGSRDHIANRLTKLFGWQPAEYTETGKAKLDETILSTLPYPEARVIAEYMMLDKRLGQLATGKQAWFNHVKDSGRIHGRVNPNGAVTGRMTHSSPNVAQVPKVGSPYGEECRSLFTVPSGKKLVGCDADGLELCMLAHYLARYDEGAYTDIILSGDKSKGTDIHTRNQKALQFNDRNNAKTWIYAFLYGAQNFLLGCVVVDDMTEESREAFFKANPEGKPRNEATSKLGGRSRTRLEKQFPALKKLLRDVKKVAKTKWMFGLDGRPLYVRSQHSALNTLLQSAGAVVMKYALVYMDEALQVNAKLTFGKDYEFVGNIHDEVQIEADNSHAEQVGKLAAKGIKEAGLFFNLRCPTTGSYDIGDSWADTH